MTRTAPLSAHPTVQDAYSTFIERGCAAFIPEFGSVFQHVGPDALDLLHRISTNNLIDMPDGTARRTVLTTEKGRIIDAPWVIKHSSDNLTLISESPNPSEMRYGILRYTIIEDAELIDVTADRSRLMVFGANATETIMEVLPDAKQVSSDNPELLILDSGTEPDVIALRTDTTGTPTWLIICSPPIAVEISSRLKDLHLPLVSQSLFDYVRVMNCVPIAGSELNDSVNPLEAGLQDLVDFDKGCYVGQEVIARLDTYSKVQRVLVGMSEVADDTSTAKIALNDRVLAQGGGRDIGWISSVAIEPNSGGRIGMGFVRNAYVAGDGLLETSGGSKVSLRPRGN